jgi:hypothetical protein
MACSVTHPYSSSAQCVQIVVLKAARIITKLLLTHVMHGLCSSDALLHACKALLLGTLDSRTCTLLVQLVVLHRLFSTLVKREPPMNIIAAPLELHCLHDIARQWLVIFVAHRAQL